MATRTVSTKVAIEGESEYRASLSRINSEIKTLQSALKLTESEYQANANSMEALRAKGDALSNLYEAQKNKVAELKAALENAKNAEQTYADQKAELSAKIEQNNKALEQLRATTADTSKEEAALTAENQKLNAELEKCESNYNAAGRGVNDWQQKLNNAQTDLNNLDAEINKNNQHMAEAEKAADGCATSIDKFGDATDASSEILGYFQGAISGLVGAAGLKKLIGLLKDAADAAIDFEASMAAVRRTVGLTEEETADMGDVFKELSTQIPVTTDALAQVASTAGQLGIAKENIVEFTTVMAKLEASTDLTADSAATLLAQFANIAGTSDYERLGATVADLGDASATTASRIVEMSQGMAAVGNIAGMSAADILGIAAALGSTGTQAQAGATAMNTLVQNITKATAKGGDKLKAFAKVAGMSAGEFKVAWEQDAASALGSVIEGINDFERNGKEAALVLEDLGISNARQQKAVLSLSTAEYSLSDAVVQANKAWDDNTALEEKAGIMTDTAKAKIEMLKNAVNNLGIEIGDAFAGEVADSADAIKDLVVNITKFLEENPMFVKALIEPLTTVGTALTDITKTISAVISGIEKLTEKAKELFGGLQDSVKSFIGIDIGNIAENMSDSMKMANPLTSGFTILHKLVEFGEQIGILSAENEKLGKSADDASESIDEMSDSMEDAENAAEELTGAQMDVIIQMDELTQSYEEAAEEAAKSIDSQIGLFDDFAAKVEEDTDTVDEMLGKWAEQTKNLATYTENLKKAAEYGIDNGFLQKLSDGSAESAGYISTIIAELERLGASADGISESASARVKEINEAFAGTQTAQTDLALEIGAVKIDLDSAIEDLKEQAAAADFSGFEEELNSRLSEIGKDGFKSIGENAVLGIKEGVEGAGDEVADAFTDIGDAGENALTSRWDEHSPSVVFRTDGENAIIGLSQGITSRKDDAVAAVTDVADEVARTAHDKITALLDDIEKTTGELPNHMMSIGAAMVDGMIRGMNSRSSALYRTVTGIVNKSIAEAKSAADVHSPSKKTQDIFENVGEGMIVGLERKRAKIVDTAQDVVNQALKLDVSGKVEAAISGIDDIMPTAKELERSGNNEVPREITLNGTIRVVGVNNNGEFISAADYAVEEALADILRRQVRR